jgi:acetyl esterase/lipase
MTMRAFSLVSLMVLCGALAAAAPDDPLWNQLDRDGDGGLSMEEAPPRMKAVFGAADANGDGKITQAEWRGYQRAQKQAPDPGAGKAPQHANMAYGAHARNKLDLWLPAGDGPFPVVVYFHGGGFIGGDKTRINDDFRGALLERGIAVAAANYRFSFMAPYPAQMHDAARAVQFLRARAADYRIDPARVGASGGSAGAGMSLWLATHDDLAEPEHADPILRESSRVQAAAVRAAQTTYDPRKSKEVINYDGIHPLLLKFFDIRGKADLEDPAKIALFEDATPLYHVSPDDAPVHLYYSVPDTPITDDTEDGHRIHHPVFGHLFMKAMEEAGVECIMRHRDALEKGESITRLEADFLARCLK